MPISTARIEQQAEYLKENGFVEGEHFKRILEKRTITDYVIYYDKDDNRQIYQFEYEVLDASIILRYKRFNGSCGTRTYKTAIDINSNGLIEEIGNIMQKRGSFKPSTILSKITYLNELADNEKIAFDKKASRLELAVAEYSKYYPNAKVTTHSNYDYRSNNFSPNTDVVKVLFPSGSYMDIAIVSEDKIIKIHDAELSNLTITQVLNKFKQQVPCGVEATA